MSLSFSHNRKRLIKWIGYGLIVLVVAFFFIRVAVWEHGYYKQKEGSERAIVAGEPESEPEEELIEIPPTENEVTEYVVAPERPRYLTIEKLGIYNARILPMGINARGELATPNNIFDVGWYNASGLPGMGGTMVIDGHNGGPNVHGVFKELPSLQSGDIISVQRGDGVVFRYRVVENNAVSLQDSNAYMLTAMRSPIVGEESVTLISCTGEWSQVQRTYLSRQFTRGVLVN